MSHDNVPAQLGYKYTYEYTANSHSSGHMIGIRRKRSGTPTKKTRLSIQGYLLPDDKVEEAKTWAAENKDNKQKRTLTGKDKDLRSPGVTFTDKELYSLLSTAEGHCIVISDIELGGGSYGRVKLGQNLNTKEFVAIKIFEEWAPSDDSGFAQEVENYNLIEAQNKAQTVTRQDVRVPPRSDGMKLFGKLSVQSGNPEDNYYQTQEERKTSVIKKHYMIMPYHFGKTLNQKINEREQSDNGHEKDYVNDIEWAIAMVDSVQKLHDKNKMVHADLGMSNFMLNEAKDNKKTVTTIDYANAKNIDSDKNKEDDLNLDNPTKENIEAILKKVLESRKDVAEDVFNDNISAFAERYSQSQSGMIDTFYNLIEDPRIAHQYGAVIKNDAAAIDARKALGINIRRKSPASYRAPEYNRDTVSGDIYALGVSLAALFSREKKHLDSVDPWVNLLFSDVAKYRYLHPSDYMVSVYEFLNTPSIWELQIDKELRNIIAAMMHPDPTQRTSLTDTRAKFVDIQTRLKDPNQQASLFSIAVHNKKWIALFTVVLIASLMLGCGGWDAGLEMVLQDTGLSGDKNLEDHVSNTKVGLFLSGGVGVVAELGTALHANHQKQRSMTPA